MLPASLVYRVFSPYVLSNAQIDGEYESSGAGAVRLAVSFDEGRNWSESGDRRGKVAASLLMMGEAILLILKSMLTADR